MVLQTAMFSTQCTGVLSPDSMCGACASLQMNSKFLKLLAKANEPVDTDTNHSLLSHSQLTQRCDQCQRCILKLCGEVYNKVKKGTRLEGKIKKYLARAPHCIEQLRCDAHGISVSCGL